MFSKLLLLDQDPQGIDSSKQCHLVTRKWTHVGPLCPQEVLKRLRSASELVAQRRGSLQSPGALGSHKDCLRVVAVWPEPTPSRVWKGAVLVMSANLCIKI